MRTIKFRAYDSTTRTMHLNPFNGKLGGMNDIFDNTGNWEYMQFTGLTDINGVEIYESDIVLYGTYRNKTVVEWNDGLTGFYPLLSHNSAPIEVIGNIYESPELLTK